MNNRFFGLIFCLSFFLGEVVLFAQPDPPTFLCVFPSSNEVVFEWANNHNCGSDFVKTTIYSSIFLTGDGPFTEFYSTTDPNETSATVVNPDISTPKIYLMTTECVTGVSDSTMFLDADVPKSPNIAKVSVVSTGTEIYWEPSVSPEAYAYLIYRKSNQGLFDLVDTVFIADLADSNSPFFIDNFAIPGMQSEEYAITTMDFCEISGAPGNVTNPHSTIYLTADYDSCALEISLEWTPYIGWDTIKDYTIYKGGIGAEQPLEPNVPNDQFSYTYVVQAGDPMPLVLSVKANNTDDITDSNSNQVQLDTDLEALPAFIFARGVSVTQPNEIQLTWSIDPEGTGGELYVSRGRTLDDMSFISNLGSLKDNLANAEADNAAETDRGPYYYAIVAQNDCGVNISSDTIQSIFLDGQDNFDLTTGLFWNELLLPGADILQYTLNRVEGGNLIPLGTFLPGTPLSYIDDVADLNPVDGQYCYVVEATYNIQAPNSSEYEDFSYSNEFCLSQTSRIFVPNTFSPNGINNLFQPVILFPNFNDYEMKVFNRWGEILFESNDPEAGWDGNVNGNLAQQGVYAYYIRMKSTNGNQLERKGTVLLLR